MPFTKTESLRLRTSVSYSFNTGLGKAQNEKMRALQKSRSVFKTSSTEVLALFKWVQFPVLQELFYLLLTFINYDCLNMETTRYPCGPTTMVLEGSTFNQSVGNWIYNCGKQEVRQTQNLSSNVKVKKSGILVLIMVMISSIIQILKRVNK